MNKQIKNYETPTTEVVEVLTEGKICTGSPVNIVLLLGDESTDGVSDYVGESMEW